MAVFAAPYPAVSLRDEGVLQHSNTHLAGFVCVDDAWVLIWVHCGCITSYTLKTQKSTGGSLTYSKS